jgi:hypothetical protein
VISQGVCGSFRAELLNGYHAFSSAYRAADTFKIALYYDTADLNPATTTVYTTAGEITAGGYAAGGLILTPTAPANSGITAYESFADAVWSSTNIISAGALIYNFTQANRAVCILNFGGNKTPTGGVFTVQFPVNGSTTSVLRFY